MWKPHSEWDLAKDMICSNNEIVNWSKPWTIQAKHIPACDVAVMLLNIYLRER